jgi:hypothetical protein
MCAGVRGARQNIKPEENMKVPPSRNDINQLKICAARKNGLKDKEEKNEEQPPKDITLW